MHKAIAHHPMNNMQPVPKQQSLPPGHLPQFIHWACRHMVWNIPFGQFGSAVLAVSPPSLLCTSQTSMSSWKVL